MRDLGLGPGRSAGGIASNQAAVRDHGRARGGAARVGFDTDGAV